MPVAVVDPNEYERHDLKSLEGGFVMVRPLPYGLKLKRRDKATRMYMETPAGRGKSRQQAEDEVNRFELETLNEWATLHDFAYCIGDHNLENKDGSKLDLGSPMTMQILSPAVGDEIERILAKINADDTDDDLEDFTKPPTPATREEQNT